MNTPKYNKVDATIESKSLIQSLRARLDLTERQTVDALLLLAATHEMELKSIADQILDAESQSKAAKKAAKAPKVKKKAELAAA
jgi:hypothetical protein